MNNIIKFLIGLVIAPLLLISGVILFALLSPIIAIGWALFFIIIALILPIFILLGYLTFIWYFVRKEPSHKKTKYSVNYSLNQSKDAKKQKK